MTIQVEARAAAVKRRLKKLTEAVGDTRPVLGEIGEELRESTMARFIRGETPTGRPWKRSKAAKKGKRKTLVRTGILRDSIQDRVTQGGELHVGTDVYYAALHQQGGVADAEYKQRRRAKSTQSVFRQAVSIASLTSLDQLAAGATRRNFRVSQRRRAKARRVRLPKRQFLGISAANRRSIAALIERHLEAAVG